MEGGSSFAARWGSMPPARIGVIVTSRSDSLGLDSVFSASIGLGPATRLATTLNPIAWLSGLQV